MKKLSLYAKAILLLALITLGCQKDAIYQEEVQDAVSDEIDFRNTEYFITGGGRPEKMTPELTVLGGTRANPYTAENFTAAYNELYEPDVASLPFTHQYITFTPASHEELVALAKSDLDIYDYPLDRQIVKAGDYYMAPGKKPEDMPQLWAVLEKGKSMPVGINYQVLANLHLNSKDEALIRRALTRMGYNPDVEGYVVDTEEGSGSSPNSGGGSDLILNSCGCQVFSDMRKPGGCIRVWDEEKGTFEGVKRVTVKVKDSWFTSRSVITDEKGCFRINRRYSGKAWVHVIFESPWTRVRASQVVNFPWLWTKPVTHKFMKAGPVFNNLSVQYEMWNEQGSDAHIHWGAATVNNALHEFRELADIEGINPPPMGLDILVARNRDDGYALMQPGQNMLSETAFMTLFASSSFFAGPFSLLIGILGANAIHAYLPDVMIGINEQNSDRLKRTVFHEIAHASHSTAVSGNYWRTLINNEIAASVLTGDPWGNAQSPGAGIIAVCESWAEHIGLTFTHRIYGPQTSVNVEYLNILERTRNDDTNHVPIGFYHDLIDNLPDITQACDRNPFVCGPINDQVSGFTNSQLFSLLNDAVFSPEAYRIRLLQANNPATHSAINNLFNSY